RNVNTSTSRPAATGAKGKGVSPGREPKRMKARTWIFFVVLAGLCWGTYVPLVAQGGRALNRNSYASLLCVGVAYFLIAVLFPITIMAVRGKWPRWTVSGIAFATLA